MSNSDPIDVLRKAAAEQRKLRNVEHAYHHHSGRVGKSVHAVITGTTKQRGDSGPLVIEPPKKAVKQSE